MSPLVAWSLLIQSPAHLSTAALLIARIKAFFKLGSEDRCRNEVIQNLGAMDPSKRADMIRALVPAVISFQIPVKLGVKLVAQTAALFWSLDHVFCNFEAGTVSLQVPHVQL